MSDSGVDSFLSCSAFPGILYLFIHSFFHPLILSIAAQLSQVYFIYSFILFFHPLILSLAAQLSQVYFIYSIILSFILYLLSFLR